MRCQQRAVYRSESRVPITRRFDDAAHVQRHVDALRDTWWWRVWYPQVRWVEVRPRRGRDSVGAWNGRGGVGDMELIGEHLDGLSVLHELAHVLAGARWNSRSHDPWWARTYLELVYLDLGSEAYAALREAFEADGIEHRAEPPAYGTEVPGGASVSVWLDSCHQEELSTPKLF